MLGELLMPRSYGEHAGGLQQFANLVNLPPSRWIGWGRVVPQLTNTVAQKRCCATRVGQ
jgi:hypothetical protein